MASQGNKGFVTEPEMIKLCRKLNIAVPTNTIKDRFKVSRMVWFVVCSQSGDFW